MHLAVFFVVNLVVAGAIGVMAYVNGHGPVGIAWRVAATLIAMQALYAIWLLVIAWIAPPRDEDAARGKPREDVTPRPGKITVRPRDNMQ
jgi:hypothetical protein